ncbi:MAG TPA: DUF6084 family protein [Tepidisphaeraceae bacterium]|jgi:hypothetical protein|nr:DUF6084 family protein [Tepidisphaeraceae bacterium]
MINLGFHIEGVEAPAHAAAPLLMFKLRITDAQASTPIHNVSLRCQVRIEPTRRRYGPNEQEQLVDLFGEPARWGQTLRSMLWAHTTAVIPPFIGSTLVDLPVPCTYDFNVAAAKYFHGLETGDVPLCFLFSGTIFHADEDGALQVAQIPWEKEANSRLPIDTWKEMMELYYPNSAWLRLRKDVFERLYAYKSANFLPSWEKALEALLDGAEESVS